MLKKVAMVNVCTAQIQKLGDEGEGEWAIYAQRKMQYSVFHKRILVICHATNGPATVGRPGTYMLRESPPGEHV